MASPVTVDYVSDWKSRLRSRLYTQFRNKTTWEQWLTLLARQFQDLEDSAQTMFTLLDIDNSSGTQLDTIGRIVGQPRLGSSDTTYRLYLKARIKANSSSGTPEEIYGVMKTLFSLGMKYIPGITKQFVLRFTSPITAPNRLIAENFLHASKEAAARAIIEYEEYVDASMFYTESIAFLTNNMVVNTLLQVGINGIFSAGESLRVGRGTANDETVTFSSDSGAGIITVSALANPHNAGESVEHVTATTGLGFGDATDATVGGYLAGAEQV